MSIHAEAMAAEKAAFPSGRTPDDGFWYGSGTAALTRYPTKIVGRPGKTRDDRLPAHKRTRCGGSLGAGHSDSE